jgi:GT2 family glycosyltransferase
MNSDLEVNATFIDDLMRAAGAWLPEACCGVQLVEPGHPESPARRFPRHRHYFVEWLGVLARWRQTPRWARWTGAARRPSTSPNCIVDWVVGAVLLMPVEVFLSAGRFDERFHMYMEEVDLQRRLGSHGIPSVYLGEVVVNHTGTGSVPRAEDRLSALVHSRLLYEQKWGGRWSVRRLQFLLSLASLIDLVADAVRRLGGTDLQPILRFRRRNALVWRDPVPFRRVIT